MLYFTKTQTQDIYLYRQDVYVHIYIEKILQKWHISGVIFEVITTYNLLHKNSNTYSFFYKYLKSSFLNLSTRFFLYI